MPFDTGEQRSRQQRIAASEPRPAPAHPVRRESGSVEEDWLPAVVHSINEATGELTFHLLDYAGSPPVVGQYEYFGTEKTGYPRPPLTANGFVSQIAPFEDAITTETPLVFAMRNRRGDWTVDLYNISETDAPSGTYVFGGSAELLCKMGTLDVNDFYAEGRWTSKAPLVCPTRMLHAGVTVAGAIYAMGGKLSGTASLTSVDQYKPDAWTRKTSMPSPARRTPAVFALHGKAYVCGGNSGASQVFPSDVFGDVDEYNPANETWAVRAPRSLDTTRWYPAGFGLPDAGYVCAGRHIGTNIDSFLRSTERYANGTWSFVGDLLGGGRWEAASFTLGGFGFLTAGRDTVDRTPIADVERFDPTSQGWSVRAALRDMRALHTASAIGEFGYVHGGSSGNEISYMRKYSDLGAGSWSSQMAMASPAREAAAAATL